MYESYYGIANMAFEHGQYLRHACRQSGQRSRRAAKLNLVTILSILMISGCAITPLMIASIDNTRLNDGVYQGFYEGGLNSALVEVSIQDHIIIDMAILEHENLLGEKAENVIIREILEAQSTAVDSVSGATNSSHVIINAAQIALRKAYQE